MKYKLLSFFVVLVLYGSCQPAKQETEISEESGNISKKIPILFDTDANNELDDQHALAYLLFNGETFDVRGVTVNATFNGGEIREHYKEAKRIMQLCGVFGKIPLFSGANANFNEIKGSINEPEYDGKSTVDFIIKEARKLRDQKLVLLPVGKLTNIALALKTAPDIKDKVRIVWLGSNYPEPGEYNLINDIPSLNYVLDQQVAFEMVMVRYGKPTGSDIIRATPEDIEQNMAGVGPKTDPVEGRHGKTFTNFGDYSVNLFRNSKMYGEPPSRALFDMVAVAILKNPLWGKQRVIPAPFLEDEKWVERPKNMHKVVIWENFNRELILSDFYSTMTDPIIAQCQ